MRRPACCSVAVLAVAGLVAACGSSIPTINREPHPGSTTASESGGVQRVRLDAGNDYRFHPSTVTVHPGKVQVVLVNTGSGAPHDWQLPRFPKDYVPLAAVGKTERDTFTAPPPGRYQFVCTLHERQGMTGTLIVRR